MANQIRVGNQDARGLLVRPEFPDRLSGLDQQCFRILERLKRSNDGFIRFPAARSSASPAVNNQLLRILRDIRVEVVHEHAKGGLLLPAFAAQLIASRGAYDPAAAHSFSNSLSKSPARMAAATRTMSSQSARSPLSGGAISRTAAN